MGRKYFEFIFCCLLPCIFAGTVSADDEPQYLFGDWNGQRTALENHGLAIESILTTDFISNVSGGIHRRSVVEGNYDLTAALDTSKAGLWENGTFFTYVLADFGDSASKFTGETQDSSNIEAPETIKLYEAWYNQDLFNKTLSLLAGLHDYNSEFDSLEYAASLRQSSFGIEPDISQTNPSIFPTTALAFRVRARPAGPTYLQAALYDGVPGDPNNPRGTHIILRDKDGIFYAGELGATSEGGSDKAGYYKAALGGWYTTTDFIDFASRSHSNNAGFYLIGEQSLWSPDGKAAGLGGFLQIGFAEADRNQIGRYFGGGLSYTGLVDGREDDVISCGVAYARNSGSYVDAVGAKKGETVLELDYEAKVTGYLSVQPDIQYIVNPGTDPALNDAVVLSVRVELSL